MHQADTNSYLEPARSLLSRGDFSRQGVPELLRTPGYPLLLTAGVALGHVEVVTVALQMLLGLITIVVIFRLTRSLTGSRPAAIAAGLLLAVEPLSLIYTSYLMAETLFTCLLVLMIAALASYDRSNSFAQLTVAALLLAAATLVRPITYFLPPVIAMAHARPGNLAKTIPAALCPGRSRISDRLVRSHRCLASATGPWPATAAFRPSAP